MKLIVDLNVHDIQQKVKFMIVILPEEMMGIWNVLWPLQDMTSCILLKIKKLISYNYDLQYV